jgi:hypothetical protein
MANSNARPQTFYYQNNSNSHENEQQSPLPLLVPAPFHPQNQFHHSKYYFESILIRKASKSFRGKTSLPSNVVEYDSSRIFS